MNTYNEAQIGYRDRCKARIQRQMEISKKQRGTLLPLTQSIASIYVYIWGFK